MVKEKVPFGTNAKPRSEIAQAVYDLRTRMNCTQRQLAQLLSVSQSQVPKWENDDLMPTGQVFAKLAEYAPMDRKSWWLEKAGLRIVEPQPETRTRLVPLLRDPAAAGTPRALDEREIADYLNLPKQWLPVGGNLYAIEVRGNSMEPILCTGFIVIVDADQRSAARLINHMVLAREGDGITVKWLRKSGTMLMLVPENMHAEHPIHVIQPGADIQLIGAVVKWIGHPTNPKKRK